MFRWVKMVPAFGDAYRNLRCVLAELARGEGEQLRALKGEIRAEEIERQAAAKGKAPRHWKSGRRSSYTDELAAAVCDAVREGASLSEVAATPGMPSFKVVYAWVRTRPQFREAFIDACNEHAFRLRLAIDEALERSNPFNLAAAKREVAAIEGRIGRLRPKLYRLKEVVW